MSCVCQVMRLLTPPSILDAANGVFDFSGNLVGLALTLQLAVASNLSGDFFDFLTLPLACSAEPLTRSLSIWNFL